MSAVEYFSIALMSFFIVILVVHIIWVFTIKKMTLRDFMSNTTISKDAQGGGVQQKD